MELREKTQLKAHIEAEIDKLDAQLASLKERLRPIAPDCSLGRLTRMEALSEQEVARKIYEEAQRRKVRLQNALSRIDKEDFGICIECDEPIGIERLKIRPESVRCVACASER